MNPADRNSAGPRAEGDNDDWLGLCPECAKEGVTNSDGYTTLVDVTETKWWKGDDWVVCDRHKTMWLYGWGNWSSPLHSNEDEPLATPEEIRNYIASVDGVFATHHIVECVFMANLPPPECCPVCNSHNQCGLRYCVVLERAIPDIWAAWKASGVTKFEFLRTLSPEWQEFFVWLIEKQKKERRGKSPSRSCTDARMGGHSGRD